MGSKQASPAINLTRRKKERMGESEFNFSEHQFQTDDRILRGKMPGMSA
jgi:hypothetical protein